MSASSISFSVPHQSPNERAYLGDVLDSGHLHGDGPFSRRATALLCGILGHDRVLLTPSGTDALEMCSLLLGIGPGDEVVLPSFTFASVATAAALFGGTPVFVDNDPLTGNIDPDAVRAAITPRTKAITMMHYGGVAANVASLRQIADEHGVALIEDNAHGLGATADGHTLGTFGDLAIQSFHDTKNIQSGEGGALIVNRTELLERAEIVREKGTDRSKFIRGQVDKYSLVDIGSSYLMSELSAAVLTAQLESMGHIQTRRHHVWNRYRDELTTWADTSGVHLMTPPAGREHPAHVFFMLMPDHDSQKAMLAHLRDQGIGATFHYVPLHDSPAGKRLGRTSGDCATAVDFSGRLVRLPLWPDLTDAQIDRVIEAVVQVRALASAA